MGCSSGFYISLSPVLQLTELVMLSKPLYPINCVPLSNNEKSRKIHTSHSHGNKVSANLLRKISGCSN